MSSGTVPMCPTRFAGKWTRVRVSGCKYVQFVAVCMGTCVRRAAQVCLCVCVYAFVDIPCVCVCVCLFACGCLWLLSGKEHFCSDH